MIATYALRIAYAHGKNKPIAPIPHVSRQSVTEPILLDQNATEALLSKYHIPTTETFEYQTQEALLDHSQKFTGPYIMKIAGKHIAHKTEIG